MSRVGSHTNSNSYSVGKDRELTRHLKLGIEEVYNALNSAVSLALLQSPVGASLLQPPFA